MYPGGICIYTILSRSACTNAFTVSSYNVSRSKLTATANRMRKNVIAKVVALVGRSCQWASIGKILQPWVAAERAIYGLVETQSWYWLKTAGFKYREQCHSDGQ